VSAAARAAQVAIVFKNPPLGAIDVPRVAILGGAPMEFLLPFILSLAAVPRAAEPPLPLRGGEWELAAAFEMTGPAMAPAPSTASLCLDASDAKNPRRLLAAIVVAGLRCELEDFRVAGRTVSWNAECEGRYHGSAAGKLTFSAESGRGEFRVRIEDARGAAHDVSYRLEAKRTGACAP
jgi:hypothetical protein